MQRSEYFNTSSYLTYAILALNFLCMICFLRSARLRITVKWQWTFVLTSMSYYMRKSCRSFILLSEKLISWLCVITKHHETGRKILKNVTLHLLRIKSENYLHFFIMILVNRTTWKYCRKREFYQWETENCC